MTHGIPRQAERRFGGITIDAVRRARSRPRPACRAPLDRRRPDAIYEFCRQIVDATADVVCAFKPQFAYFAAQRAEPQLERVVPATSATPIPTLLLILDAKRGDIGSTAEQYAREAFERYGADAVTVNPYLGTDSVEPFLRHAGRGVFVLCRTSNPGGGDFQSLDVDGEPLYMPRRPAGGRRVERRSASAAWWSAQRTPTSSAAVRAIVGDMPMLVPGVGAQGGDIEATVAAGADGRRLRDGDQLVAGDPVRVGRRRLRRGGAPRGRSPPATRSGVRTRSRAGPMPMVSRSARRPR